MSSPDMRMASLSLKERVPISGSLSAAQTDRDNGRVQGMVSLFNKHKNPPEKERLNPVCEKERERLRSDFRRRIQSH